MNELINQVHCMDCFDLMDMVESHSIDAIIADPPYNMTNLHFETSIDWERFWIQTKRILRVKASPVLLFSQQPFTTDLIISNRKGFRNEIIYEKTMATGFLNAKRRPLQAHENILVFADASPTYYPQKRKVNESKSGTVHKKRLESQHYHATRSAEYKWTGERYPRSVWKFQNRTTFSGSEYLNPTQKPIDLLEMLIRTYTQPGDLVLDPFAGSGTTGLAALRTGRRYILGDSDAGYVEAARQRIQTADPMQDSEVKEGVIQRSLWGG